MSTVSKSPYEIRLTLLHLAFDILTAQARAAAEQSALLSPASTQRFITKVITSEEVLLEAEKLNKFVSKNAPGSHS